MADQVRRAVAWVYRNARRFGGNPNRLYVSGHSSGAHLAGVVLTTDWKKDFNLPSNTVKGGLCCSGLFDLRPVRLSVRSEYITFDDEMEHALSPQLAVRCELPNPYQPSARQDFSRPAVTSAPGPFQRGCRRTWSSRGDRCRIESHRSSFCATCARCPAPKPTLRVGAGGGLYEHQAAAANERRARGCRVSIEVAARG
jgi:hypothetical protein